MDQLSVALFPSNGDFCRALEAKGYYKCLADRAIADNELLQTDLQKLQGEVNALRQSNAKLAIAPSKALIDAATVTDDEAFLIYDPETINLSATRNVDTGSGTKLSFENNVENIITNVRTEPNIVLESTLSKTFENEAHSEPNQSTGSNMIGQPEVLLQSSNELYHEQTATNLKRFLLREKCGRFCKRLTSVAEKIPSQIEPDVLKPTRTTTEKNDTHCEEDSLERSLPLKGSGAGRPVPFRTERGKFMSPARYELMKKLNEKNRRRSLPTGETESALTCPNASLAEKQQDEPLLTNFNGNSSIDQQSEAGVDIALAMPTLQRESVLDESNILDVLTEREHEETSSENQSVTLQKKKQRFFGFHKMEMTGFVRTKRGKFVSLSKLATMEKMEKARKLRRLSIDETNHSEENDEETVPLPKRRTSLRRTVSKYSRQLNMVVLRQRST